MTQLVMKGVQRVIQEPLEQDVTDYLGRDHYERREEEEPHRGYRNGYEPKKVKTAEGGVEVKVPQLRETVAPYRSRVLDHLEGLTSSLERMVQEMYARGLSTRDIEDLFRGMLRDNRFCLGVPSVR